MARRKTASRRAGTAIIGTATAAALMVTFGVQGHGIREERADAAVEVSKRMADGGALVALGSLTEGCAQITLPGWQLSKAGMDALGRQSANDTTTTWRVDMGVRGPALRAVAREVGGQTAVRLALGSEGGLPPETEATVCAYGTGISVDLPNSDAIHRADLLIKNEPQPVPAG